MNDRTKYLDLLEKFNLRVIEFNEKHCEIKEICEALNKFFSEEYDSNDKLKEIMNKSYRFNDSDIVKLNIGGRVYSTYRSTLSRRIKNPNSDDEYYGPNLLEGLASGLFNVKHDENNAIFIDRNHQYFDYIIDYLRTADTDYEFKLPSNKEIIQCIEKEAEYYKIEPLIDLINTPFMDSTILSKQQKKELMKLCDFAQNQMFSLLYRASDNGFAANDFHLKCDKVTHTIIKSTNGKIFGGFTEAAWSSNGGFSSSSNSFIFSLVNRDGYGLIMKCVEPQYSM